MFLADCRCPVDRLDLRMIARAYVIKQGRKVSVFKDNVLPGIDWCLGFEKRHPCITFRNVANIKTDRAALTEKVMQVKLKLRQPLMKNRIPHLLLLRVHQWLVKNVKILKIFVPTLEQAISMNYLNLILSVYFYQNYFNIRRLRQMIQMKNKFHFEKCLSAGKRVNSTKSKRKKILDEKLIGLISTTMIRSLRTV